MTADSKDAWLVRWEYFRRPPTPGYEYPLAHVHINAALLDRDAESPLSKPLPHLHIPTARVPFELVLWHVLAEWGVASKTDDWRTLRRQSLSGFEERRTAPRSTRWGDSRVDEIVDFEAVGAGKERAAAEWRGGGTRDGEGERYAASVKQSNVQASANRRLRAAELIGRPGFDRAI